MEKLKAVLSKIEHADKTAIENAQKKLDNLTKPLGSLGKLENLAKIICGIQKTVTPSIYNKTIIVAAGDHGVAKEGVSAFPQEVTGQMVYNFLSGGAGINVLAKHIGAGVTVVDAGVASDLKEHPALIIKKIAYGTKNIAIENAMTKEQAVLALEAGIEVVEIQKEKGVDIIGTGDMGIGNTTPSSAITSVITGLTPKEVTGRGTGINDEALNNKIKVIEKAININKPNPKDGIDVLCKLGGFEIGCLAGVILGCASNRIPVVIDGFISGAAALIAYTIEPKVKDYIIASHCSAEKGHIKALSYMGLEPLFDLNLRLGEGTGAALGISLAEAGVKIMNEMATFTSARVSEKSL